MDSKSQKLTIFTLLSCFLLSISNLYLASAFGSSKPDPNCLIYTFGDSNTDVGSGSALVGLDLKPPYGQHFFQESVGHFSDGRVYLDYICEGLGRDYLSPYPELVGANFSTGAGFAVAGASTVGGSFSLRVQVDQFAHYQKRIQKLRHQGKAPMISEYDVKNAMYLMDIGQNDFNDKFITNSDFGTIVDEIPKSIESIQKAIEALYKYAGARKFWISNTGPLGCLPLYIATAKMHNITKHDKFGCVSMYNLVAKNFNNQLRILCDRLRSNPKYKDANIVYINMYKIKHALFATPAKYGFEKPLTQCCFLCSQEHGTVCSTPAKSVMWDDVHFTEASHKVIASKVLSGNYSSPPMTLQTLCKLRV